MRIAILGYYHSLNYGDDRIMQCWSMLLREHQCSFFLHHAPPLVAALREFDLVIIGGGGLVWNRTGIWKNVARWTSLCGIPVGVAGLGVNELPEELVPELNALIDAAGFFYVRDTKSRALLNNHPRVQLAPDLSWLFPFSCVPSDDRRDTVAINFSGSVGPAAAELSRLLERLDAVAFPLNFGGDSDAGYLSQVFNRSVIGEFCLQPLVQSRYAIVTRFHAVQFAVQTGTPFIAVIYDDKVTRFLEDQGLLDLAVFPEDIGALPKKVTWLERNLDTVGQRLCGVRDVLVHKARNLAEKLLEHVSIAADAKPVLGTRVRRRLDRWVSQW